MKEREQLIFCRVKIADEYSIRKEEVEIRHETRGGFKIAETGMRLAVRKSELGVVSSGFTHGSFQAFCYERETEQTIEKLKSALVGYHEKAYRAAGKNIIALKSAGLV